MSELVKYFELKKSLLCVKILPMIMGEIINIPLPEDRKLKWIFILSNSCYSS